MTKIGQASIEVKLTKSRTEELLEEILGTLKRIEQQGKPKVIETSNVFTINTSNGIDEEQIRKLANRELYWRIGSDDGSAKRESVKENIFTLPEAKEFMADAVAKVEEAPEGTAVKFGIVEGCKGCEDCDCG